MNIEKDKKEYWRTYYKNNKERISLYHKDRYDLKKDEIKQKRDERLQNPEYKEHIRKVTKNYRENNKEKIRAYYKKWKNELKKDPIRYQEYLKKRRDYRHRKKA